jgi:hypothetical protein
MRNMAGGGMTEQFKNETETASTLEVATNDSEERVQPDLGLSRWHCRVGACRFYDSHSKEYFNSLCFRT